jgi:hypothetical protein
VGEAFAGGHANARAHELHGGHQRPGDESSPEKRRPHLRAGDRVSRDTGRIVICRAGYQPGTESRKEAAGDARPMSILRNDREVCGAHVDDERLAKARYSVGFGFR